MSFLERTDPEVFSAIQKETQRLEGNLELIASENVVSEAVLEAQGCVMTNKYAECYPGKRYYGGCEFVDEVESLAIARAKELFGAQHANVQPHSGTPANMTVYLSVLKPGDTYLGMNLAHGGHLSMGSPVNFSGILYRVVPYGVSEKTETIDYDEVERLAKEHRPKLIVAGASAYPRAIDFARFGAIADEVGATLVVDMAHVAGLVAAKLHPDPVPHAAVITSTTHKTLRGPRRAHRQGGRGSAPPGRHHRQQERGPGRPAEAVGDERHPRRHRGAHDARHGRRRDADHRRLDRARAGEARRRIPRARDRTRGAG